MVHARRRRSGDRTFWFSRYGGDRGWFEAPGYQIETISVANGQNLQAGEVNSLISQMAAFAAQVDGDA